MLILFALLMSVAVITGKDLGEELSDLADAFTRLTRALPPATQSRGFGGSISYVPNKKIVSLWVGPIAQHPVDALAVIKKPAGKSPIEIAPIELQKQGIKYVIPITDPGCSPQKVLESYTAILETIVGSTDIRGSTRKYLRNAVFDLPPEQRSSYIDLSSGGLQDITTLAVPMPGIGPDCSEAMVNEIIIAVVEALLYNSFLKKSNKLTEIVVFTDATELTERENNAFIKLAYVLSRAGRSKPPFIPF